MRNPGPRLISWLGVEMDSQAMALSIAKDVRELFRLLSSGDSDYRQDAREPALRGEIKGRLPFRRLDTFGRLCEIEPVAEVTTAVSSDEAAPLALSRGPRGAN